MGENFQLFGLKASLPILTIDLFQMSSSKTIEKLMCVVFATFIYALIEKVFF